MRAIVLHGPNDVRVESVADPRLPDPRGAIVRVTRASICGSDLHLYHGTVPAVPGTIIGHECVGVVEEVGGEVRHVKKGDRVIVPGVIGCGECPSCRAGYVVGCTTLLNKVYGVLPELPGAQAEALAVPHADSNLFPSPGDLSDEQLLFLTDILPTGYYAAENADIEPGQTVAVVGCGPVGLFAITAAHLFGPARILALDQVASRLAMAQRLGATPVEVGRQDPRTAVLDATDGRGADAVIEAVGTAATVQLAFDLVRIGGTVSVVGVLMQPDFPFPMGTAFMKDLTFRIGLVNVPRFVHTLLPLVRSGRIDPTLLISHRLPLAEGRRAYELFDRKIDGCLKVVLAP
jgi:2-desacetyl-2-hydroxyethyl bacteriochlorophyllide A dehydrogenase